MPCGPVEAGSPAIGAGMGRDVAGQLFPHRAGFGFPVATLHVADDALERMGLAVAAASLVEVTECYLFPATAVEYDLADFVRQLFPGGFHIEIVMLSQRAYKLEIVGVAPVPSAHRAGCQAEMGVSHHPLRIEKLLHPEAVTGGAGTDRIVERKESGFQFLQAITTERAGEISGKYQLVPFRLTHPCHPGQAT